jgi:hypothetical protein
VAAYEISPYSGEKSQDLPDRGAMQVPVTEGLERPVSIIYIPFFNREHRIYCNVPDLATQQGLVVLYRKKTRRN